MQLFNAQIQIGQIRIPAFFLASVGVLVAVIAVRTFWPTTAPAKSLAVSKPLTTPSSGESPPAIAPESDSANANPDAASKLDVAPPTRQKMTLASSTARPSASPRDGAFLTRHPNGKPAVSGRFERDQRVGTWRRWDDTGRLLSEDAYTNNETRRAFIEFYPNGKRRLAGEYVDGDKAGVWRAWDQRGKPLGEIHYENGVALESKSPHS